MSGKDGGWVLPTIVHPEKTVCFKVVVPDEQMYLAAFFGALWELQYWFNWQRDSSHTGIEVANVWRKLLENLKYCDGTPVNQGFAGADGGDDFMLRQNPDNPCLLETSVNGVDWCVWADLSKCTPATDQPGSGAEQPHPNGGQACYDGKLVANQTWLVPTVVNTGDVITLDIKEGAGTDGTIHWYCGDGHVFFAGGCIGAAGLQAGDPMATAFHMEIVAVIAGTFYKFTSGTLTVPAGVSNEQVTLQVNDASLADNSGDYNISVCVTNNQAGTFSHTQNLAVNPGLFGLCGTSDNGVYTPGTGFEATTWGPDGFGHFHKEICVKAMFSTRTLTRIAFKGNLVRGSTIAPSVVCIGINDQGGAQLLIDHASATDGTNQTWQWTGSASFSSVGIFIETGVDNSDPGGSALVFQATIEGLGVDPF